MKKLILLLAIAFPMLAHGQDDLIKKIESNHSYTTAKSAKSGDVKKYHFNDIIDLEHTDVKSQAGSGTCWSYSTNSFLESEMMRMGKQPIELSQIFSARCVYR